MAVENDDTTNAARSASLKLTWETPTVSSLEAPDINVGSVPILLEGVSVIGIGIGNRPS